MQHSASPKIYDCSCQLVYLQATMGDVVGVELDSALQEPEPPRSSRRSTSNDRLPSRRQTLSPDCRSGRNSVVFQRRPTSDPALPPLTKAKLCYEGFFYANQYEGPYGNYMALIIHVGNGMLVLGLFTAVFTFIVFRDRPGTYGRAQGDCHYPPDTGLCHISEHHDNVCTCLP